MFLAVASVERYIQCKYFKFRVTFRLEFKIFLSDSQLYLIQLRQDIPAKNRTFLKTLEYKMFLLR